MNESHKASPNFASTHSGTLMFIVIACVIFASAYLAYEYFFVDTISFLKYLESYGTLASKLLSQLGVSHEFIAVIDETNIKKVDVSRVIQNTLKNDNLAAKVLITAGTDARIFFAIVIAFTLAWPGPVVKKVVALIAGVALVYALNVLRIAGMFIVDVHLPLNFAMFKDVWLPLIMITITLLYCLIWIKWSGRHPDDSSA